MNWYIDKGPESDVILTSRVRLARNVEHYPFPHCMDNQQACQVADEIVKAFFRPDSERKKDYLVVDLDTMNDEDLLALAEKRLISSDLAQKGHCRRVIISRDESVSIMINEEDHIRIQSMQPGLNLEAAYAAADAVALSLEQSLSLAYSENYGFLTACPTNTGTGMRASVMAHLPGLALSGKFKDIAESLTKMSFAVRGIYGEGSKSEGHLVQVSNQLTLGISEEDLINDLKRMLQQLIEQERKVRREILKQQPAVLEDRIMRAYGVLRNARLMTREEAVTLLSDVRLGISLGLLPQLSEAVLNRIQSMIGPASVQKAQGRLLAPEERDSARATLIRDLMK
jgi:protein arginine kinase